MILAGLGPSGDAFLPEFNEGSLTVNVTTLAGTSLDASDKAAAEVEAALLSQPEVATTARRTGRAPGDPHAQEVFAPEIEATLKPGGREREQLLPLSTVADIVRDQGPNAMSRESVERVQFVLMASCLSAISAMSSPSMALPICGQPSPKHPKNALFRS